MRRKSTLLVLVFLVGFLGCSSSRQYVPVSSVKTEVEPELIRNYRLNDVQKCYVGDPIVKISMELYDSVYRALVTVSHVKLKGVYFIKGNLYQVTDYNQEDGTYLLYIGGNQGSMGNTYSFWAEIYPDGRLFSKNAVAQFENRPYSDFPFFKDQKAGDKICEKVMSHERKYLEGSFRKELIYHGKTGSNIKVLYREFKNDFARPAFYQDLTYDLQESDIVRYKNFRILVLEATNEEITYKVLEE